MDVSKAKKKKTRTSSKANFYCDFCKRQVQGKDNFEEHNKSAYHLEQRKNLLDALFLRAYYCYSCDKTFDSKFGLDSHCLLMRHQQLYRVQSITKCLGENEQRILSSIKNTTALDNKDGKAPHGKGDKPVKKGSNPEDNLKKKKLFYCDICDLDCASSTILKNHLESWKHKTRIDSIRKESCDTDYVQEPSSSGKKADQAVSDLETKDKNPSFYCDICNIPCRDKSAYMDHVSERTHHRKLSLIKPPFRCYSCCKSYKREREFEEHLSSEDHIKVMLSGGTKNVVNPVLNEALSRSKVDSEKYVGAENRHGSVKDYRERNKNDSRENASRRGRTKENSGGRELKSKEKLSSNVESLPGNSKRSRNSSGERKKGDKKDNSKSELVPRERGKWKPCVASRFDDTDDQTQRARSPTGSSSMGYGKTETRDIHADSGRRVELVNEEPSDSVVKDLREKITGNDLREKIGKGKSTMLITKILEKSEDTTEVPAKSGGEDAKESTWQLNSIYSKSELLPQPEGKDDECLSDLRTCLDEKALTTVKELEECSISRRELLLHEREKQLLKYHDLEEEYKKFRLEEDYLRQRLELRDISEQDRQADLKDLSKVEYIVEDIQRELDAQEIRIQEKEREIEYERENYHKTLERGKETSQKYSEKKNVKIFLETEEKAVSGQPLPPPKSLWSAPIVEKVKQEKIIFEYNNKSVAEQFPVLDSSPTYQLYNRDGQGEIGSEKQFSKPSESQTQTALTTAHSTNRDIKTDATDNDWDLRQELEKERLLKRIQPELQFVDPVLRGRIISAILATEGISEKMDKHNQKLDQDNNRQDIVFDSSSKDFCSSPQPQGLETTSHYGGSYEGYSQNKEFLGNEGRHYKAPEDRVQLSTPRQDFGKENRSLYQDNCQIRDRFDEDFINRERRKETWVGGSVDNKRLYKEEFDKGEKPHRSDRKKDLNRKEKEKRRPSSSTGHRHRGRERERRKGRRRSRSRGRSRSLSSRSSSGSRGRKRDSRQKRKSAEKKKDTGYLINLSPNKHNKFDSILYQEKFLSLVGKDATFFSQKTAKEDDRRISTKQSEDTQLYRQSMANAESQEGSGTLTGISSQIFPSIGSQWPAAFSGPPDSTNSKISHMNVTSTSVNASTEAMDGYKIPIIGNSMGMNKTIMNMHADGVALQTVNVPVHADNIPVDTNNVNLPRPTTANISAMFRHPNRPTHQPAVPSARYVPVPENAFTVPSIIPAQTIRSFPNQHELNEKTFVSIPHSITEMPAPPALPLMSTVIGSVDEKNYSWPIAKAHDQRFAVVPNVCREANSMSFGNQVQSPRSTGTLKSFGIVETFTSRNPNIKQLTGCGADKPNFTSKSESFEPSRVIGDLEHGNSDYRYSVQTQNYDSGTSRGNYTRPKETFDHWKTTVAKESSKEDIWELALDSGDNKITEDQLKITSEPHLPDTEDYRTVRKQSTTLEQSYKSREVDLGRKSFYSSKLGEDSEPRKWNEGSPNSKPLQPTKGILKKSILKQPTKYFKEQEVEPAEKPLTLDGKAQSIFENVKNKYEVCRSPKGGDGSYGFMQKERMHESENKMPLNYEIPLIQESSFIDKSSGQQLSIDVKMTDLCQAPASRAGKISPKQGRANEKVEDKEERNQNKLYSAKAEELLTDKQTEHSFFPRESKKFDIVYSRNVANSTANSVSVAGLSMTERQHQGGYQDVSFRGYYEETREDSTRPVMSGVRAIRDKSCANVSEFSRNALPGSNWGEQDLGRNVADDFEGLPPWTSLSRDDDDNSKSFGFTGNKQYDLSSKESRSWSPKRHYGDESLPTRGLGSTEIKRPRLIEHSLEVGLDTLNNQSDNIISGEQTAKSNWSRLSSLMDKTDIVERGTSVDLEPTTKENFFCDLCDLAFSARSSLNFHFTTQRHTKALEEEAALTMNSTENEIEEMVEKKEDGNFKDPEFRGKAQRDFYDTRRETSPRVQVRNFNEYSRHGKNNNQQCFPDPDATLSLSGRSHHSFSNGPNFGRTYEEGMQPAKFTNQSDGQDHLRYRNENSFFSDERQDSWRRPVRKYPDDNHSSPMFHQVQRSDHQPNDSRSQLFHQDFFYR